MIDWSGVRQGCAKIAYETRRAALANAKHSGRTGQRTYQCPDCGYIHLTALRRPDRYRKTLDTRKR